MTCAGCSSDSPAMATSGDHPVITPGGPRPRESVRGVGPGEIVVQTGEGILRVVPASALEEGKESARMADDLVLTPGGLRPRSQVRLIESGALIDGTDGRLRKLGASGEMLADFGVRRRPTAGVALHPGNVAPIGSARGRLEPHACELRCCSSCPCQEPKNRKSTPRDVCPRPESNQLHIRSTSPRRSC
jgi:hypothetical protein